MSHIKDGKNRSSLKPSEKDVFSSMKDSEILWKEKLVGLHTPVKLDGFYLGDGPPLSK